MKITIHSLFIAILAGVHCASAQGTAFSYQGKLNDGNAPANGIYDLRFTIYDAPTNGDQAGATVTNAAVVVSNGLFTTLLDLGNVFDGNARWLEIGVRTNGSGGDFVTLSPRQPITPAPYAIFANTASNVNGTISASQLNGSIPANQLSGMVSLAQLPATLITNGASGVNISGTFSGDGSGLANVPGTMTWQAVSGTNQTASANEAYLLTNGALDTVTLPVSANVGDIVTVSGAGSDGWQVLSGAGQEIAGEYIPAGTIWTAQTNGIPNGNQSWSSVASSADGTKLVAAVAGGQIYTSTDSGTNWTAQNSGNQDWVSVTSSADGTKLVAAVENGQIYTSTDSGTNWSAQTSGIPNGGIQVWSSVASSADGSQLVAVYRNYSGGGQICTSSDSGTNWTVRTSGIPNGGIQVWSSTASSADGAKIVAAVYGGQIYTSTDSGTNWTVQTSGSQDWYSVASSADGTKLAAATWGGQIYASNDSGTNWTVRTSGSQDWNSVASSADGTKLVAAYFNYPAGGQIYTSNDSGTNWTAQNSGNQDWQSVASSADGAKLVAVVNGGQIYTSDATTLPFEGTAGETAQFQYVGNDVWQPVLLGNDAGSIPTFDANQTFTGVNTFANNVLFSATNAAGQLTLGNYQGGTFGSAVANFNKQVVLGGDYNTNYNFGNSVKLLISDYDNDSSDIYPIYAEDENNGVDFYLRETNGVKTAYFGGSVGIGTNTPAAALDVNGNIHASGNVYAGSVELTSDRNAKENFDSVNPETVLAKVTSLPITEWNYKTAPANQKHLGPMAQDFQAAFGLNGSDNKHISVIDEGGVALAAIQGLNQKLDEKDAEIAELKARLDKLEKMISTSADKH